MFNRDKEEESLYIFSRKDPRRLGAHPSRISRTPGAFAEFLFATGKEGKKEKEAKFAQERSRRRLVDLSFARGMTQKFGIQPEVAE